MLNRPKLKALTCSAALRLAFIGLAVAPVLSGCGFQPLYGHYSNAQVAQQLAAVKVTRIPGRVGQKLRNEVIFGLYRGDYPEAPSYRLDVVLRESQSPVLKQITGQATQMLYHLEADYKLIDLATEKVLFKATTQSQAAYDRVDAGFANLRAKIDAENRAATVIAQNIKNRIAAFFSSRS